MPDRAAPIRRATRQARQALQVFTDEALQRLRALYLQTSRDLGDQIDQYAGSSSLLSLQVLRDLRASIDQRLELLGRSTAAELNAALPVAAQLGSQPFAATLGAPLLARVSWRRSKVHWFVDRKIQPLSSSLSRESLLSLAL